ncbi:hypothetical protein V1638_13130 [Pseudarthrobacter sp. J64]|uniref:hypothetical protein n=1 Tax=Pseudarthrobacter sp. J64 TaxID=3116485 RepID=UPI002E80267C|nr:hypothetical protein [Pseudarthrobacter sp. J64]MEE2570334.1 hypothetical protein [Pseudarthrobacter sp. J64]
MGLGDSISKAAENAMEDLAGTSTPEEEAAAAKKGTPDPADPQDDVEVHSSLSEGSNAMDKERREEGERDTSAPGSLHNDGE